MGKQLKLQLGKGWIRLSHYHYVSAPFEISGCEILVAKYEALAGPREKSVTTSYYMIPLRPLLKKKKLKSDRRTPSRTKTDVLMALSLRTTAELLCCCVDLCLFCFRWTLSSHRALSSAGKQAQTTEPRWQRTWMLHSLRTHREECEYLQRCQTLPLMSVAAAAASATAALRWHVF